VLGKNGLYAPEVVALDDPSEKGCVYQPSVQILITENVKGIHMKKENATNNVVQVCWSLQRN